MHKKSIHFPKNYENQLLTIRERSVKPVSYTHLKMGMVMLAYKTHCTILPVAIVGEGGKPPKVFKKMVINIGKPIRFEDMGLTEDSGMIYRRVSRNIFAEVQKLREEGLDIMENRWKEV